MGQRPTEKYSLSDDAIAALTDCDVPALLKLHHEMFGGWKMEGDEGDGAEEDDSEGDDEDEDEDDEDEEEDPKEKSKGSSKVKELSDENARRRNEAKQLKAELAKSAKKLKELEDAKLSDDEKVVKENGELKAQVEKLTASRRQLALHNAFLQDRTNDWHNPKAALKLLDLDGVEIDDEGDVTGLDKAIAKLAKENPYLLKAKDEEETSGPPASGQPPVKPKKSAQRQALEKKYRLGV